MRGSLVNSTADFVVHEHAASAPRSAPCSAAAAASKQAGCPPARHASPSFVLPAAPGARLPLLYRPDARFARRTSASIGYACNAQQSDNMQLSLQWQTVGQLRRWEKERPYALRDDRERQQRRARGEREEEKQPLDLFAAFPASVHPVPAAAAFDLHENHPLLPPAQAASSTQADSLVGSAAARRLQARRLLAEGAQYDPFASSTLPFFAPSASHYTAVYTAPPSPSSCSRSSLKVHLTRHPAAAYTAVQAAAGTAGYRGKNNRWTEERLFFRGFSSSGQVAAAPSSSSSSSSSSQGVELLFSSPLYSSFSLDGQYREPQRTRKQRPQQWSRLQPPTMRRTQPAAADCEDRADSTAAEAEDRLQAAEGQQEVRLDAEVQKAPVRLSGVFVPRVDSRRFMSSFSSRQTV